MSRPTRGSSRPVDVRSTRRPLLVWLVYALGILAAAVMAFSILFLAGAYLVDDVVIAVDVSPVALVVWSALIVLAAVTWAWRRRSSRSVVRR